MAIRRTIGPVLAIFLFFCSIVGPSLAQSSEPSEADVAKWRRFMESLSPELRRKFDALHAEAAAKADPEVLQRKVKEFVGQLSAEQKKVYTEIQQRGGGGGQSRPESGGGRRGGSRGRGGGADQDQEEEPIEPSRGSRPSGGSGGGGSRGRGGADQDQQEEPIVPSRGSRPSGGSGGGGSRGRGGADQDQQEEPIVPSRGSRPSGSGRGSGGVADRLDQWIDREDLAQDTRDTLRKIKDIFARSDLEAPEQCEQIQRLLKGISTRDKARLKVPTELLGMDCAEAGGKGPQNLVRGIGTGRHGGTRRR